MENLGQKIVVRWKNFNSWTTEFNGTIGEYLKENGITYTVIFDEDNNKGYIFNHTLGGYTLTLKIFNSFEHGIMDVIGLKMLHLGDRASVKFGRYNKKYN
jgi:NAD kinase